MITSTRAKSSRSKASAVFTNSTSRCGEWVGKALPEDPPSKTTEEIILLAFHSIDPDVFPAPSWLMDEAAIDGKDAELIFAQHAEEVTALGFDRDKYHYLQGVLDSYWIKEADRKADGETD